MDARESALREGVREAYSRAALRPEDKHPFPVGKEFAESLGYPPGVLARIPGPAVEAFTGVSNVSVFAEFSEGATVVDLGCGAGLDSLIAASRVGESGRVVGMDFSEPMLQRARESASRLAQTNLVLVRADAERLPLASESVDVALANGIFNLNPRRDEILLELARIVRPGGVVFAAELILNKPLPADSRTGLDNWFA